MSTPVAVPSDPAERIEAMDVLRGFALLGVLFGNLQWFTRPLQAGPTGAPAGLTGLDYAAAWFVAVFVDGKFWILFSLLFGMGFVVMLDRARQARRHFGASFFRRSAMLAVVGLAHALLVWWGDILMAYAMAAVLLFLTRNWRGRTQLIVGLAGITLVTVAMALVIGRSAGGLPPGHAADAALAEQHELAVSAVYAHGSYVAVTAQRWRDLASRLFSFQEKVPSALLFFLIGAWLARSDKLRQPQRHRRFYLALAAVGVPLGLAMSVLAASSYGIHFDRATHAGFDWGSWLSHTGAIPQSFGYLGLVMCSYGDGKSPLAWLAPLGRMALTNYLLQSLVFTTLFYGYGLGLWGRVPYAGLLAMGVACLGIQVALSRAWLARHRFGPLEWLWRYVTYWRRPVA